MTFERQKINLYPSYCCPGAKNLGVVPSVFGSNCCQNEQEPYLPLQYLTLALYILPQPHSSPSSNKTKNLLHTSLRSSCTTTAGIGGVNYHAFHVVRPSRAAYQSSSSTAGCVHHSKILYHQLANRRYRFFRRMEQIDAVDSKSSERTGYDTEVEDWSGIGAVELR